MTTILCRNKETIEIVERLTSLGYEVISLLDGRAIVRERDIYGQPVTRELDVNSMIEEGLLG